jgi:hypothetical protein
MDAENKQNLLTDSPEFVIDYLLFALYETSTSLIPSYAEVAEWIDILKTRQDAIEFSDIISECETYIGPF